MNREYEKIRRIITIGLILLGILIIVIMAVNILGKRNKTNNVAGNTTNYVATPEGNKVNTSQELAANKTVGDVVIEKSEIVYTNGVSKLTSKVTNNGLAQDNLRFTVKFMADDGSVIAEAVGYVGAIGAGETRAIYSDITTDVSNAKDIVYEVIK